VVEAAPSRVKTDRNRLMTPQGRKRAQQAPNGRHGGILGYSLRRAVEHFNKAVGSIESDILGTTRQLKGLGAAGGSKDIPTVPSIGTTARTLQLPEADTTATTNQTTGIPPELAPVDQTKCR
jgi:hypothetical protein